MTPETRPKKRESLDVQVKKKAKIGAKRFRESVRFRRVLKEMDRDLYGRKSDA